MGKLGCVGRFRSNAFCLIIATLSLWNLGGCGKSTKAGSPLFPAKVNLTPSSNTSIDLGTTFAFSASAQTASGTNLSATFTYASSDTSILNVAPNGVACAGHWDVAFTTCTPGGTGVAQVTVTALGASSIPTWVFVHPPIDNITVSGVLVDGIPVQEPCLSQGQSMTVEARAFSQGSDITSSVGPFTFSAQNSAVVNITGVVNTAYNFATNQTKVVAVTPGMTQIYATASGVSSSSFHQPQYQNSMGTSPALDFFETCPIRSITLEVGVSGSQKTAQTSFVTSKGSSAQNATAVLTDVMGNTSLPNTNNGIVLSKIPLTWTSSNPAVVNAPAGCLETCALATPSAGSASVTASCSPPGCNIGYPSIPTSLSTPKAIAACTNFFDFNCQQLIPVPVYASSLAGSANPGYGAISGLVTGLRTDTSLLATSTGCAHLPPSTCTSSIYSLSTSKATSGSANSLPAPPNSLLFDLGGDKAFMGSDFGALLINPANFGGTSSPYTGLSTITGKVLASSNDGSVAIFSDTIHTPNQVYVVNVSPSFSASALNIPQAVSAAFSPDGLKAFIFGNAGTSLYVYSSLQALQGPIAVAGTVSSSNAVFSPNGAFAYVAEASANGNPANITAFNTCNNQVSTAPVLLPGNPLFTKVLPGVHLEGRDSFGFTIPDGIHVLVLDSTGFDILTSTIAPPVAGTLCPQILAFVSNDPTRLAQRIELGQGTIQPVNFFASADGTQLYVPATGNASILVYDFGAGSITSGIELTGNATPLSADISPDTDTILIAGSDGLLHEVSTGLGGSDQVQLSFPNLPNYLNPFCALTNPTTPCTLNLIAVKP